MRFVLDTDHISIIQRGSGPEYIAILARIALYTPYDVAYSVVSFHEQTVGANAFISRARNPQTLVRGYEIMERVMMTFRLANVIGYDAPAAAIFSNLRRQGVRIGTMDLRLAAIALARNLVVVTRNARDFSQVPGLMIEDWTV